MSSPLAPAAHPAVDRLIRSLTVFNQRSKSTTYQYRLVASHFVARFGERASQDDILSFLETKKAPATKAFTYAIIKRLYVVNAWAWPLPPGVAPRIDRQRQQDAQVRFDDLQVARMVQAVRPLGLPERSYLALGSVYGLRREELASLSRESLLGGVLRVQTVKGGRLREHTVPPELLPHLKWLPKQPSSIDILDDVFHNIAATAAIRLPPHSGWHAFRRSLVSRLRPQVRDVHLAWFMGWRTGGEITRMLSVYAAPNEEEKKAVDIEIYAKHPYLPLWH